MLVRAVLNGSRWSTSRSAMAWRTYSWPMISTSGPKNRIAVRVIEVKVCIDYPADGIIGDQLHVLEKRSRRRGSRPGIHQKYVIISDNNGMITTHGHRAVRSGVVHAVGNFLKRILLAGGRSSPGPRAASPLSPRIF